jgi:dsDNA-specific endonuclease/ATPase MutS2
MRSALVANGLQVYWCQLPNFGLEDLMEQVPQMPEDPIEIPVTDVFDLHSIAPRDVKIAVEAYLEEAHHLGFHAVRIVHGRGIGVQRETVRSILSRTPFVIDFRDAPTEAGGWGATIVTLAPDIVQQ